MNNFEIWLTFISCMRGKRVGVIKFKHLTYVYERRIVKETNLMKGMTITK